MESVFRAHMNSEHENNTLILDKIKETREKKVEEFQLEIKNSLGLICSKSK